MTDRNTEVMIVQADNLTRFCRSVLAAAGLPTDQANIVADALVNSELRNLPAQGQGVIRLPKYCARIQAGQISTGTGFKVLKESPSLALVDAGNGAGRVTDVLTDVLSGGAYGTVPYSDLSFLNMAHQFIASSSIMINISMEWSH